MPLDFRSHERAACGVGFVANRNARASHQILELALDALSCVEHRGACAADRITGDGAGIMADIPFAMLGYDKGDVAVATLFVNTDPAVRYPALEVFQDTFNFLGLEILDYRPVPIDAEVLGDQAREDAPEILHAIIKRPPPARTDAAFNARLYAAKQMTRTKLYAAGAPESLFFTSLSTNTIVYKALTRAEDLPRFYSDLTDPRFATRFALFHRRFSTNTRTSWDKAQPFRLTAHNGEINTIAGNRSWCYSREQALGVAPNELLTHVNISDSGNLNEMVEALKYRSSIPHLEDILAIMIPPAGATSDYYAFWGRAMEPWDGPAFIAFADGETIGARLDRNGFRPCRWAMSDDMFYLASEAGVFAVDAAAITAKGILQAGSGVTLRLDSGELHVDDPSISRENRGAVFKARLSPLEIVAAPTGPAHLDSVGMFGLTRDDFDSMLVPMITEGKEPISSMGDTARPAILSDEPRSFFDFFFQGFAQVTNPPLDYLRERIVTDLSTYLGKRPNIFATKELIPPAPGLALPTPILSLAQMASLRHNAGDRSQQLRSYEIDCLFARDDVPGQLRQALTTIGDDALAAVGAHSILILTHRRASATRLPVPSLLALRAVVRSLNRNGLRLETSIVLDVGDVFTTHHVACCISFGATAVSPYLAMEIARFHDSLKFADLDPTERDANLASALESGLLKIMSKMGISVVRSYQSSKLFTLLGLDDEIVDWFFPGKQSLIGGIGLDEIEARIARLAEAAAEREPWKLLNTYQLKEHPKGLSGEKHVMTAARAKVVHKMVRGEPGVDIAALRAEYQRHGDDVEPAELRHLLELRPVRPPLRLEDVQPRAEILATFGAGAMSFGAISAEAQRDIIIAMQRIGGRSNSGEGGENPYYYSDGITATTKQVASGRFGVTAEFLINAEEIEIKIAQGAKPGEGGQLMGIKVDAAIARARHATVGATLISPPPLHDLYSIEDLKQLIYELGQLAPDARICVKLVSGADIGTIAVGVAKAGADVIQISGGSGGTGAAPITSMKHAGLPWEIGLAEAHQTLVAQNLRGYVTLRVDGGLHSGRDVVIAAALGAEQFGFGKLLLVAQGCIMARICEKNRCPTGIATHDPRFKAKYKGRPNHIVRLLEGIADEIREQLGAIGASSLAEIVGRTEFLRISPRHEELIRARGLRLGCLLDGAPVAPRGAASHFRDGVSALNAQIVADARPAIDSGTAVQRSYSIRSTDRALLTHLSGVLAARSRDLRQSQITGGPGGGDFDPLFLPAGTIRIRFDGSAGQGFAAFLVGGIEVALYGEANDSVCKSMSGGTAIIRPSPAARFAAEQNVIIGSCALYGGTGGELFVSGLAGDRFCVRNSGALAVVEGVGLHACEYMTGGTVVILGPTSHNIGAGMTGGVLYLRRDQQGCVNAEYLCAQPLTETDATELRQILVSHHEWTQSRTAAAALDDEAWDRFAATFVKCVPAAQTASETAATAAPAA